MDSHGNHELIAAVHTGTDTQKLGTPNSQLCMGKPHTNDQILKDRKLQCLLVFPLGSPPGSNSYFYNSVLNT